MQVQKRHVCALSLFLLSLGAVKHFTQLDYDQDEFRTTCQIVQIRGFDCETHHLVTSQGYILQVHRILPLVFSARKRRPIILQHGLSGTSVNFIIASASVPFGAGTIGRNIAFELAKRGYDVWLPNNRGNEYGMRHISLNSSDAQFWNYTFDEISRYDLPSIIDYVRGETGQDKVAYLGNSQGTTVMFALLSDPDLGPKYSQLIEPFIALSPVTRIGNATTIYRLVARAVYTMTPTGAHGPFGHKEGFFPQFLSLLCNSPLTRFICMQVIYQQMGYSAQIDERRVGVYAGHVSSVSKKNILHFHQLFTTNRFARFDYGPRGNLEAYGQTVAPEYDLTRIDAKSCPIHVIYSLNDLFTPIDGLQQLTKDIPKLREMYQMSDPAVNHGDPLIGRHAAREVNHKVINILKLYP